MMQFRLKIIFLVRILKTMTWQKNVIKPPVGEKNHLRKNTQSDTEGVSYSYLGLQEPKLRGNIV